MRFDEAFKEMIDNAQPISRGLWEEGCLIYNAVTNEIEHDTGYVTRIWRPTHEDVLATDWEII